MQAIARLPVSVIAKLFSYGEGATRLMLMLKRRLLKYSRLWSTAHPV
jgi:hypothetical protein